MDLLELGAKIGVYYIPFLFALCFHEFAHGWMAKRRGDNTAESLGRLTMNPVAHMDPIGTFLLPMIGLIFPNLPFIFGWAKPVPFNPRNLKNPRVDSFWIALAGPMSNMLLAVVGAFLIGTIARYMSQMGFAKGLVEILSSFVGVNLMLAFFNLIPLHPLDGGKVVARFLPRSLNYKLEQNEHVTGMILLVLIMIGALKILIIPVSMTYEFLMNLALGVG